MNAGSEIRDENRFMFMNGFNKQTDKQKQMEKTNGRFQIIDI